MNPFVSFVKKNSERILLSSIMAQYREIIKVREADHMALDVLNQNGVVVGVKNEKILKK